MFLGKTCVEPARAAHPSSNKHEPRHPRGPDRVMTAAVELLGGSGLGLLLGRTGLGKVSKIICVFFVENSTKGGRGSGRSTNLSQNF